MATGCSNILGLHDVTKGDAGSTTLDGPRPAQQSDPGSYVISTTMDRAAADAVAMAVGSDKQRGVDVLVLHANRPVDPLCQVDFGAALYPLASAGDGEYGFCWTMNDPDNLEWIPRGITTTGDALPGRSYGGEQLAAITWRNNTTTSTRISVAPAGGYGPAMSYRHVLLVAPQSGATFTPVACDAGGAVWYGDLLYVACTDRVEIFDWRDVYAADTDATFCDGKIGKFMDGTTVRYCADMAAYFMLQVGQITSPGGNVRFSSISLDQASAPARLVVVEYSPSAHGKLVRFNLDASTRLPSASFAADVYDMPFALVHGATTRADKFWFQSDDGTEAGTAVPGKYSQLRFWNSSTGEFVGYTSAYGADAISFWPGNASMPDQTSPSDMLFTLTEPAKFRAVIAVRRTLFE
ncbi:MAG TPA: hypothetical protein VHW23_06275 [Kofleriaceae bacterium]|nr:hypothetical protein [Kofleriaceae bacterium]